MDLIIPVDHCSSCPCLRASMGKNTIHFMCQAVKPMERLEKEEWEDGNNIGIRVMQPDWCPLHKGDIIIVKSTT